MMPVQPPYPVSRARRLRQSRMIRDLVRESTLLPSDLIWPIFLTDGNADNEPIESMPGVARLTIRNAIAAAKRASDLGIPVLALFPATDPELKSPECEEAWNPDNLANRAIRAIKEAVSGVAIMVDVALDPYNADGHDGLVRDNRIMNDETVECLVRQAIGHASAGADILGPSDMMDGRIAAIRAELESQGYSDTIIMSYSAKFASAFYGPFRDAIGSSGALKGDKTTYQLDPGNAAEALRMIARDLSEGADMVMVKPGLPYLDICSRVKRTFQVPTFAYQVSGEYAMIMASAQNGWAEADKMITESLLAFKRAGCDGILTHFAPRVAEQLARV